MYLFQHEAECSLRLEEPKDRVFPVELYVAVWVYVEAHLVLQSLDGEVEIENSMVEPDAPPQCAEDLLA